MKLIQALVHRFLSYVRFAASQMHIFCTVLYVIKIVALLFTESSPLQYCDFLKVYLKRVIYYSKFDRHQGIILFKV